jgi:hypothetical protein
MKASEDQQGIWKKWVQMRQMELTSHQLVNHEGPFKETFDKFIY